MKKISDREFDNWCDKQDRKTCGFILKDCDMPLCYSQAQLEACEQEHKAVLTQLFEEIERLIVPYGWGRIDISRAIRSEDWQALKQKYGGE